jgi:nanoRNase/pAp phosphatase (c-di-AMP/oligoRNAs hydrolase)
MQRFFDFFHRLKQYPRVVIQAHDFPDHDAIASAFALSTLFNLSGIDTLMVYSGNIDRVSIENMIRFLAIPIRHWEETDISESDIIVTVDGCVGEKNVTDLPGKEVGVIDHHDVKPTDDLWFCDIRREYGATATIIYDYYMLLGVEIPIAQATALQIGLAIDTANLTRGFCQNDIAAFAYFHRIADQDLVGRVTRNSIQIHELRHYEHLLANVDISGRIAVAVLDNNIPKNMLGILADFLLALDEVDTVIIASYAETVINLSLRSECNQTNVAQLVRNVVTEHNIGFGGGHSHMAGGIIRRECLQRQFPEGSISRIFFDALKSGHQIAC